MCYVIMHIRTNFKYEILQNSSLGANVKLHNGGTLGLDTSRNVSDVSNSSILLFAFSDIKGPAKELTLPFMSGEKCENKILVLFSGYESAEVSPS